MAKRMKNILSDNAGEAWTLAKKLSAQIRDGLVTFQYRKMFVACLHNATELYIKAAMVEQNDLRLLEPRNVEANGCPAKDYYSTIDLNTFLANEIKTDTKDFSRKFHSCEYNKLLTYHKELFDNYYCKNPNAKDVICNSLKKLEELRNNETHFSVNPDEFLTASEFAQLHNFMVEFYKVLIEYNLLPFFGEPHTEYRLRFDYSLPILDPKSFSYKKALMNSERAQKIAHDMLDLPCTFGLDPFAIADEMVMYNSGMHGSVPKEANVKDYDHFDEIVAYIEQMINFNLVDIVTEETRFSTEDSCGSGIESWYKLNGWKLTQ